MAYSAKAIANFFIRKAYQASDGEFTLMKLLKLVYIAHGWHLALYNTPLIDEPVQAWKFGPVIESLYHEFRCFGLEPMTFLDLSAETTLSLQPQAIGLLDRVWEIYHPYTGIQLSNWTHVEGSPWHTAWYKEQGRHRMNHPISNAVIKTYFSQLATERHGRTDPFSQNSSASDSAE